MAAATTQYSSVEGSLADRRRSTVSKYLESDNHKSEFALRLRDLRDRERTVSGGTLKASASTRMELASQLENPGVIPQNKMADGWPSTQFDNSHTKLTEALPGADAMPTRVTEHVARSVPEQHRHAQPVIELHRMSAFDALSGRRQTGRQSMGGLMVINETLTPSPNASPIPSESSPCFQSSMGMSTFPGFNLSPFQESFKKTEPHVGTVSPGTHHGAPNAAASPLAESIKTLLAAPRAALESELKAKFSYLSALADENNQLRELLQRQADMSPAMTHCKSGATQSLPSSPNLRAEEDCGKDEIIQTLSLQLADQMDTHDKVIFELGLLRSHHATLQALSSDYLDELEVLRHQVRDLEDQVITGQAETEEMRKHREEEEEARRSEAHRVQMLRQALEDSKMAIKRLQDQSNQRRQSLVDSRRMSISSNDGQSRSLQSLGIGHPNRGSDTFTMPFTRRGSVSADRRASLLNNPSDYAAKSRRRASMALAAFDAEAAKSSRPRSTIEPVGLGFDILDAPEHIQQPRRNSSGGLAVHIEAMSPRAGDNSPTMTAEKRDRRKQEIKEDVENLCSPGGTWTRPHRQTEVFHSMVPCVNQVMIDMTELAKLKAESAELDELKSEMALLKVKFAECEEAKLATSDALNALRQYVASHSVKAEENLSSPNPDSKKTSRWGMSKMSDLVSKTTSLPTSMNILSSPATPTMSSSKSESTSSSGGAVVASSNSSIFSWNRRNDGFLSSTHLISPSTSPRMDGPHAPTPAPAPSSSSISTSSTFGRFSLASLVGPSSSSPSSNPSLSSSSTSPTQALMTHPLDERSSSSFSSSSSSVSSSSSSQASTPSSPYSPSLIYSFSSSSNETSPLPSPMSLTHVIPGPDPIPIATMAASLTPDVELVTKKQQQQRLNGTGGVHGVCHGSEIREDGEETMTPRVRS